MSESQSRYGILEEMNRRKISVKQELASIEATMENQIFLFEREVIKLKDQVVDRERSYKRDAEYNIKELEAKLKMIITDQKREVESKQSEIHELEDNYEEKFQLWKANLESVISKNIADLDRYKLVESERVNVKRAIIEDIDSSIKDIKDISKEQA